MPIIAAKVASDSVKRCYTAVGPLSSQQKRMTLLRNALVITLLYCFFLTQVPACQVTRRQLPPIDGDRVQIRE